MDLYARKGPAIPQKLLIVAIELCLLLIAVWLMFGGGEGVVAGLFGFAPADTVPARRYVIMGFSCIVLVRMTVMMFVFLKRQIPWSETLAVPSAFALYYVGFALSVLPSREPLGLLDHVGIALFVLGSGLNTGSELQRHRFKADPANAGKLYTGGLFRLSMHINFFGDVVWIVAYAILAANPWAFLIPAFTASFFAFYNVPLLDRHLAAHYGAAFTDYAARTKRLIPFVW